MTGTKKSANFRKKRYSSPLNEAICTGRGQFLNALRYGFGWSRKPDPLLVARLVIEATGKGLGPARLGSWYSNATRPHASVAIW